MSQPAICQTQTDERVSDDSGRTPSGIERADPKNPHIEAVHFGIFNDQVRDEVQKLQSGLSTVDSAITELTKAFGKYGKIVSTVGERYGADQVLEKKIRELEITSAGIWKHIEKDRNTYQKETSELKTKHEKELATLQAQANAGEQEKKKYEEMKNFLGDQHDKVQQKMDRDLKQKRLQLENDNAEKIANLETEKTELKNAKSRLEHELTERTMERDREKETRETMQNKARVDIRKLEKTLIDIKANYKMDQQPSHFYVDRYKVLIERVSKIATIYFTNLPNKAVEDPVGTSSRLVKTAPSFARVPIANSECSQVLRLANVQHLIFNVLCDSVWQRFFSGYLWKHGGDMSPLPEIHSRMAAYGEDVQQNWTVSTLKILDQLDEMVDLGWLIDELIDQKICATLKHLLDNKQVDQFKHDLKGVFTQAIELGKVAERDQSPVCLDKTPSVSDRDGWKEYWSEEYETSDTIDTSLTSPTTDYRLEPLFVSPKIFRWIGKAAPTAVATVSATATAAQADVDVIQSGAALFPDTGIFQEGASDWERIRGAGKEVARNINGKVRRQSTSMSMTGSEITPRSPRKPSKTWPRDGTREFD